ncbi:hypothetical protein OB955_18205 [Halobacteria archaeon AArc-m2/3/4]|uniref:Halobacterial output domain-containing protein n=1 Tax=Natronoglomus mannanivorans TaxID=2979990 RepID=A0AAP2Z3K7_9EURY|nr:hypothetical protein [Halobacteria archaeon AArc-xg1-1]MCU4974655.1 hypothetical protein [Halobacteria archaeon AArc-m2/3/4]
MGEQLFHGRYTWSSTTPTVAIANAIAGIENVDSTALSTTLETTLYDQVNPEALDVLITDGEHIAISFVVDDYRVEINGEQLHIALHDG